jgi:putative transcriptional regulator
MNLQYGIIKKLSLLTSQPLRKAYMAHREDKESSLSGQLLIAMPSMQDPRFEHSVIFICAHSADGAMGLIVNKPFDSITFPGLLEQLGVSEYGGIKRIDVQLGGPVEASRGFVLHSQDYIRDESLVVDGDMALTATLDILRAIADDCGPRHCLLALGYAGWGPGQLDMEILNNGWLNVEADEDLVFGEDLDAKWAQAMNKLGIDPRMLSDNAGHA